ncbi:helix-turn-helix domain-containing protein [Streptomyces umbrinus]|uniref:helix-turn-helix domain-containing protein n=1 Tax=Streptomyces umbrinus TaxID=67370 RepID=UPI00341E31F6
MPAPLNMTARRAMVAELRRQEPDISARKIAARLGVGKDAILRDIAEIEMEQRQRAAEAETVPPDSAPPSTADAPEGDTLVIRLDEPMRQALAVLRAQVGAPDTPGQNRAAARAAIRSVADTVLEARQIAPREGSRP